MVQWLQLHASTAGAWVQTLVRELRSPHTAWSSPNTHTHTHTHTNKTKAIKNQVINFLKLAGIIRIIIKINGI